MSPSPDGLKILLVDDYPSWLERLSTLFEGVGYHITTATSVEEGWSKFLKEKPDLIITDYEMLPMPGGDGDALIKAVRGFEKEYPTKTFIHVLSGYHAAQDSWRYWGADGYTDKNPYIHPSASLEPLLQIPQRYFACPEGGFEGRRQP